MPINNNMKKTPNDLKTKLCFPQHPDLFSFRKVKYVIINKLRFSLNLR